VAPADDWRSSTRGPTRSKPTELLGGEHGCTQLYDLTADLLKLFG
jgi:hypothetical protein